MTNEQKEYATRVVEYLQDPAVMRNIYATTYDDFALDETTAAVETLDQLIKQAFGQDHDTWVKWDRAANALFAAAEEQGFVKGCALAGTCVQEINKYCG